MSGRVAGDRETATRSIDDHDGPFITERLKRASKRRYDGRSPRDRELRRYETILDSLDDAVYAVRPDGTIAYVNDRYAEMKGVSREALLGTDIYDWVTEETAEKATQVRNEMAAGDRDVGMVEYEFLTADGERFPAEMRFNRVTGEEGEELNRVGVIRDVRERKRREEALRRKNERLEEFASIVSHDLRNPLNVAQGRLDLARASTTPSTWRSSPTPTSEWRRSSTTS